METVLTKYTHPVKEMGAVKAREQLRRWPKEEVAEGGGLRGEEGGGDEARRFKSFYNSRSCAAAICSADRSLPLELCLW